MMSAARLLAPCFAAALAGSGLACLAQSSGTDVSPFLPPAGAAAAGASSVAKPYELAGVITTSQGTQVCIYDVQGKHSHWIAVGKSSGDIKVVSFDAASGHAVITVQGAQMPLDLRKVAVATQQGTPMPAAFNPPPQPVQSTVLPPPGIGAAQAPAGQTAEQAKQEREARMLVSDLLEIGMQQRKAYEEAQKKAQQAGKAN